jgi:hypothetical protein
MIYFHGQAMRKVRHAVTTLAAVLLAIALLARTTNLAIAEKVKPTLSPAQLAERTIARRAIEAVIWIMPAVNYDLMLQEMLSKAYPVDDRGLAYTYVFVGIKNLGAGQFYLLSLKDKNGHRFDGGQTYRLHVPPNVPIEQYWSATGRSTR